MTATTTLTSALAVIRGEWPSGIAARERQVRHLLRQTCRVAGWPLPPPQAIRVDHYAPGTRRRLPPRVHPRHLVDDLVAGRIGLVVATAVVHLPGPSPREVRLP